MDLDAFLRLLLDPDRLAVVGAIARGPRSTDEVVAVTGVERRTVLETLAALEAAGVLADGEDARLAPTVLRELAGRLPQPDPPDARVLAGMTAAERDVLVRFFRGDRLTRIPSSRAKRRIVLERLALEFEPGRHYPEAEVNQVLRAFHPDHASLRRYLVDEGLLDRDRGTYWRSGGRVVV